MKAEIITIGDEILIGQIVDTNSQWIGKELNKIGVSVYQITSIQDKEQHILNALQEAKDRVDIVIVTGGLGPTKDDITKKTLAKFFNDDNVVSYPEVLEHIKGIFKRLDRPVNAVQKYQAEIPSTATLLFNDLGTAPGMWFLESDTVFVSLPGVPYEMKGLMTAKVLPRIQAEFDLPFIVHNTINTFGVGESSIAECLEDFEDNLPEFISLAYLPSPGSVRLRLSGIHEDEVLLKTTIKYLTKEIQVLIPDIISGIGEDNTLEKKVGDLLKSKNLTLCTAESMTGGKIASSIVSVSGASSYFKGGFITYSSELKEQILDVSKEVINKYSVVSSQVAELMAKNARIKLNTDYAISITGNAGPTTDTNTDKVGLVYIGIASTDDVEVFEFDFGQPREKVIQRTLNKALGLLIEKIVKK